MSNTPKLVFGTAGVGEWSEQTMNQVLDILRKYKVDTLDTAYIYANSEATLSKYSCPSSFTIDTKAPGWTPSALTSQSVLDGMTETLRRLDTTTVNTYYLHAPDTSTPIEETLTAINQLHSEGKFKHFGLSNFPPSEVEEIHSIQKSNNAILPTVFQGNYNALSRTIESDLFPLLRKLNMSFYAYSPIAGGFLVKDPSTIRNGTGTGRWDKSSMIGGMYNGMYGRESLLSALDDWETIAKEEGISKAALAYRWITFHSALDGKKGDAVILGASKPEQLEESLKAIGQGPLSEKSVKRVEEVWKKVEHEAPRDNYHR